MQLIEYTIDAQQYSASKFIETNCIDVTVVNQGASTCIFGNIPVLPGGSISITGNIGEIIKERKNISFTGAGANLVLVIRRMYTGQYIQVND